MEKLADEIWIFDGEPVPFFGFPFSTRMTVVRLSNGALWVHSPMDNGDRFIFHVPFYLRFTEFRPYDNGETWKS